MIVLALLVGTGVLCGYITLAGPTFYWLDSSELTAAAWGLGVAHPPGHPLSSLLAHPFCWLPVGSLSFRVTLASAVEAAAAAALVTAISAHVLGRLPALISPPAAGQRSAPSWVRPLCAAVAGLMVGLSYALGFQAVRSEVYALNLLVLAAAVLLLLRWDARGDRRALIASALLIGLGLCNHHLLIVLALPALLVFVLARRPRPLVRRALVAVLLAGVLGLSVLAYLPLRAARLPEANWGYPVTAERLMWVVSAKAFQRPPHSVAAPSVGQRAAGAAFALLDGLGPVGALLSLGGLYLLWRQRQTRKVALLLSGLVGLNLLSPFFVGFDPFNPDAHGYLAVAVAFLSPGLAVLLASIITAGAGLRHGRALASVLAVGACALPMAQGALRFTRCDLRTHWAAEETARQVMRQPPGALLFTSFFETVFNSWAIRATGDLRPDLSLVARNFLGQPGYLEALGLRHPELTAQIQRWQQARQLSVADLQQLSSQRPLRLEYDLNLSPELTRLLGPDGLLLAYTPGPVPAEALRHHQQAIGRWLGAITPQQDNETRRAVAWAHYQLARYGCQRQLPALAAFHLRHAQALAPADRTLRELARRCFGKEKAP